jgi:predicted dehydrogenase
MGKRKSLRVGAVGVGHLGREHARVMASLPGAELVGVYDARLEVGRQVAKELGTLALDSLDQLLSLVEAVSIAAPTTAHFEIASECISRGIHVLVEKPLAATVEEARALVEASQKHSVIVQTGHIERFNPIVQAALSVVREPRFIESHRLSSFVGRSTDVDVVLDLMIHDIDLALATVQSEIRSVEATGVPILSSNVDIANARLLFANGAVANLTASRVSKEKIRKIRFFSRDSYISVDCLGGRAELYKKGFDVRPKGEELQWEESQIAPGIFRRTIVVSGQEPLRLELEHFVKCVTQGERPVVDGMAGLRAMEVALRVSERIREGIETYSLPSERQEQQEP